MKPWDILLFPLGHRGAILRVANSPWALVIGALLCLTAGMARHYDHEYYLGEPWRLGIGLLVAGVNATILYAALQPFFHKPDHVAPYASWLAMFLMSAPCAWIYAIPLERLVDHESAIRGNMILLGVVSVWRVLLMIRCLKVAFGMSVIPATVALLTPIAAIVFAATMFSPVGVLSAMAGTWVIPPDMRPLHEIAKVANGISFFGGMILILIYLPLTRWWGVATPPELEPQQTTSRYLVGGVAAFTLALFVATIPWQREVGRLEAVQALVDAHDYDGAVAYLSQHERDDFGDVLPIPPSPYAFQILGFGAVFARLGPDAPQWLKDDMIDDTIAFLNSENRLKRFNVDFSVPPEFAIGNAGILYAITRHPRLAEWVAAHPETTAELVERSDMVPHIAWHPVFADLHALGVPVPMESTERKPTGDAR